MGEVEKSMDIPCQARGQHWKMYFYIKFSMDVHQGCRWDTFSACILFAYPKTQSYHCRAISCTASAVN